MSASVRSMTGYGRGEHIAEERKFTVEMKSVNHRYNDMTIKLPRSLAGLEDKIKKRIMHEVFRGKTDVYISFETFSAADVEVKLNEALAAAYIEKLKLIEEKFGIYSENKLELAAKFPDVITVEKAQQEEEVIWEALVPALDEAVEKFVAMRTVEGENLKKDILLKGERIRALVAEVKERSPLVVVEYQEKLNNRLKDLLGGVDVDPQRIATEVAVFADRGCVDEEVTRLESHLIQLKDILDGGGQVGRKLDFLIQAMVKTSRLEAGVITLEKKDALIEETLVYAINGILAPMEKKGIELTVDCPEGLTISHDSRWTSEALFNLLDNAVKYTPAGGSIHVSVQNWEMYWKIDVTDTGRGIPEQEQATIFKRFYREEAVHEVDGIGIGLYLAREIITMQGGYILVTSEVGKGSTFSVFLPQE